MNEITIQMSEKKKLRTIRKIVLGGPLFAAIGLIIFSYAYLRASDNFFSASRHVVAWLVGLGFPVLLLWNSWSSWKRFKTEKWTEIKFRVDEIGIRKEFPDGEVVAAEWRELRYVAIPERILYFEDGLAIRIYYDIKGQTTVRDEEWLTVVKQSGSDSVLTNATIEREAAKPNINAEWGIRAGTLVGILLLGYQFAGNPLPIVIGGIALAAAGYFIWYQIQTPQRAVDERYAPPEDFQATIR